MTIVFFFFFLLFVMIASMNNSDLATEALSCARYDESEELVQILDANPRVLLHELCDTNGNTPLHMACANGHLDIVTLLCRRFPLSEDINAQNGEGNTALHWAALNGHEAVIKNHNGCSAMTEAQGQGQDAIVTELLALIDDDTETAGSNGSKDVVQDEDESADTIDVSMSAHK
ncbi:ankyrin repeat-containing domain protein [Syncephalis fuscata]|nr:ankyrin repeat-containing domain protein [Syncephalis fuscata]